MQAVKEGPPWAVDAWGVGCLMQEAFSGRLLMQTEDLRNTEQIPKAILQVCEQPRQPRRQRSGQLSA